MNGFGETPDSPLVTATAAGAEPEHKRRPSVASLKARIRVLKDELNDREGRIAIQGADIDDLRAILDEERRQKRHDYERFVRDREARDLALTATLTIALGNATPVDLIGKLDKALKLIGAGGVDKVRAVLKDRLADAYSVSVPRAWDSKLAEEAKEKDARDKLGMLGSLLPVIDRAGGTSRTEKSPADLPDDCVDPSCPFHGRGPEFASTDELLTSLLRTHLTVGSRGEAPFRDTLGKPYGIGGPDSMDEDDKF